MIEPVRIETAEHAAEMLASDMTAAELRAFAKRHGVVRKRGDTKRQTADRVVEQAPAAAAEHYRRDPAVVITWDPRGAPGPGDFGLGF